MVTIQTAEKNFRSHTTENLKLVIQPCVDQPQNIWTIKLEYLDHNAKEIENSFVKNGKIP